MKFVRIIAALAILSSATACADRGQPARTDTLHVEVSAVVERGTVTPVDGITSSGQPDQAAFEVFSSNGYVAVIDIRGEEEDRGMEGEQAFIENLGMDYVSFPIEKEEGISFENAAKLDELIGSFDGPVLVHCGSGNRVGALLALRKSLDGASDEEAFSYGKEGGLTRLEDVVKERLGEEPPK